MEDVYGLQRRADASGADSTLKRRWGPLFVATMNGYARLPIGDAGRRVLLRGVLAALYLTTLWLLVAAMTEQGWPRDETRRRQLALAGIGLQSTSAIYAITNGMGEVVTALCIVAHFVLFMRRRYVAAALVIGIGVYFKLYPIVFLFPYFVFALLSRAHRPYAMAAAAAGAVIALASAAVEGWRFGFLYPISMVGAVVSDADLLPILSKETFGPVSFIARAAGGFRVRPLDAATVSLARTIAPVFSALLLASTAAAAVVLEHFEPRWDGDGRGRRMALTVFQASIGFLMFTLSMDISIALLLPVMVSLYAPLWLPWTSAGLVLFLAGLVLSGHIVPLSMLLRVLPFGWLDRLTGNPATALIPHEKYMWYQVPMIGVALLCASWCCGVYQLRRNQAR